MGQGNSERAIEDYNLALVFDPSNADAYNNRGAARYDRGDYAGAVADYGRALRINPRSADALYNRGLARKAAGERIFGILDAGEQPPFPEAKATKQPQVAVAVFPEGEEGAAGQLAGDIVFEHVTYTYPAHRGDGSARPPAVLAIDFLKNRCVADGPPRSIHNQYIATPRTREFGSALWVHPDRGSTPEVRQRGASFPEVCV